MRVDTMLRLLGGAASWGELIRFYPRTAIDEALRDGRIVRASHGTYTVAKPSTKAIARQLRGVVSHHTAADLVDMGTVQQDPMIHITVNAHSSRVKAPAGVRLHFADLSPDDVDGLTTNARRTVIDCARSLPFPRALTIADAAVRSGRVSQDDLINYAARLRGRGSAQARKVVHAVDLDSQTPMESLLRGILLDAGLTQFVPQYQVMVNGEKLATVDLGDPTTMTLLEADSFAWHGSRVALADDARRYDTLVAAGYAVLRFAWEHLIHRPEWVVDTVHRTLALRS